MGVEERKLQVHPCPYKVLRCPLEKEDNPKIGAHGLFNTSKSVRYLQSSTAVRKHPRVQKSLRVDSSTVLSWIRTPPRQFKPFVSGGVAEIQETVGVHDFRYIRSKSNPADTHTRGTEPSQLTGWVEGPAFLQLPEIEWPSFQVEDQSIQSEFEVLKEMKPTEKANMSVEHKAAIAAVNTKPEQIKTEDNPILHQLSKTCSSFLKVRRTLAYVRRFVQNARKTNAKTGPITVEELKESENLLFKWSQVDLNSSVIDKKLIPKLDENGLLRAHGRLEDASSLPRELRNPVILPRDNLPVKLLLCHLHDKRGHCGYKSLIHEARRKYWIIGVRSMANLSLQSASFAENSARNPSTS